MVLGEWDGERGAVAAEGDVGDVFLAGGERDDVDDVDPGWFGVLVVWILF